MKTLRPLTTTFISTSRQSRVSSHRQAYFTTQTSRSTNHNRHILQQQYRTFLSNPFNSTSLPQKITATRTLNHPSSKIYDVISDVASYSQYLPYCQQSVVTQTSSPAPNGKTYPSEAKLVIGFGDQMREEFWSRVSCVPETIVEAVSGNAESSLPGEETRHHGTRPARDKDPTRKDDVLGHLVTRWTLNPKREQQTEVSLAIEVQFSNPVYAALSQAAVPKVADRMIEAFERRIEEMDKR